MKPNIRALAFLFLLASLLLSGCAGIPSNQGGLVVGNNYRLDSGETLDSDLTVIGGNARLENGSTINGDMVVIGGNVMMAGQLNGDLAVMGGFIQLEEGAVIRGSVRAIGGTVQRSPGAVVEGQTVERDDRPGTFRPLRTPMFDLIYEPVSATLMAIFQALALAALAIVVSLFALQPMNRVGQTAVAQAPASGGVGCLTLLVLVIMSITIILLPVSLIGFLAAGVAALFGWIALGLVLGRRLAVWLNQPWSDPVSAGAGTLALSLLASLINVIPCVGWLASFLITMIGIGAVVLSRFGAQLYPTYAIPGAPVGAPPAPYSPPAASTGSAEVYPAPGEDRPRE